MRVARVDVERSHRRVALFLFGLEQFLQREEPRAWKRLVLMLARHGFVLPIVEERRGRSFRRTTTLQGELTAEIPSGETLRRLEAFARDDAPVPVPPRMWTREPWINPVLTYYATLARTQREARERGTPRRLQGEEPAVMALKETAEMYDIEENTLRDHIRHAWKTAPAFFRLLKASLSPQK